jgi:3-hydroxyacyl-CoA dehydrogenase
MGGGIAALAASAGVPVVLLDIPASGADRSATARGGLDRAKKSKPAAFMDVERAALVTIGNTDADLALLAECDVVVEAIIEQIEPKRALYERLETILPDHVIIASNTSGIPINLLTEGRSSGFQSRFLGMHFFNPPRYLHLLEIIPTSDTAKKTIDTVRQFSDRVLGKNRRREGRFRIRRQSPGVFGMVLAIRLMEKHGLTID